MLANVTVEVKVSLQQNASEVSQIHGSYISVTKYRILFRE